ncbi:ABC transporter permease [Spirochaetia bacterium]|nr:ABC transporter permease [Spirochaetia bacterium]
MVTGRRKKIAEDAEDVIVKLVSYVFITLLGLVCLYPYLNVVAKSFSSSDVVNRGLVNGIFPKDFSTESYGMVFNSSRFVNAFMVTVYVTLAGTFVNTLLTIFTAFTVSRKNLPGSRLIMFLFIFSMLFSGGMIPTFLVVVGAGLRNNLWSLIIPGLVSPFNLILMRSFFDTIPASLEESALMDGADPFKVLFRIIIPLSMPSIATIVLFNAVGYWNTYFNAMIYIDKRDLATLQIYLRELMLSLRDVERSGAIDDLIGLIANDSLRGAAVFASTLPIIIVYPFLQKYFVKGMILGAVKE